MINNDSQTNFEIGNTSSADQNNKYFNIKRWALGLGTPLILGLPSGLPYLQSQAQAATLRPSPQSIDSSTQIQDINLPQEVEIQQDVLLADAREVRARYNLLGVDFTSSLNNCINLKANVLRYFRREIICNDYLNSVQYYIRTAKILASNPTDSNIYEYIESEKAVYYAFINLMVQVYNLFNTPQYQNSLELRSLRERIFNLQNIVDYNFRVKMPQDFTSPLLRINYESRVNQLSKIRNVLVQLAYHKKSQLGERETYLLGLPEIFSGRWPRTVPQYPNYPTYPSQPIYPSTPQYPRYPSYPSTPGNQTLPL